MLKGWVGVEKCSDLGDRISSTDDLVYSARNELRVQAGPAKSKRLANMSSAPSESQAKFEEGRSMTEFRMS